MHNKRNKCTGTYPKMITRSITIQLETMALGIALHTHTFLQFHLARRHLLQSLIVALLSRKFGALRDALFHVCALPIEGVLHTFIVGLLLVLGLEVLVVVAGEKF